MSILNDNSIDNIGPSADMIAKRILQQTRQTFRTMTEAFNQGSRTFWQNYQGFSPEQLAQALGTNAREVFELHYALGQFINSIQPEAINEGWSIIGNFTMNDDGTVTILHNIENLETGE